MFDKFQKYLLLHHPLLWNIKIVPLLAVGLALHVIFFLIGYAGGTIDFTDSLGWHYNSASPVIVFFSILLSILLSIIWLVFYFRNNAYKSFYKQARLSLFKEWLLILVICTINCTFSATYLYADEARKRNYVNEEEFSRRIDIISMASLFAEGGYQDNGTYYEVDKHGNSVTIHRDSFKYHGKKYPLNSLLNKTINDFTYQSHKKDSLNEVRVKNWLQENRKDSVRWVMDEFLKIASTYNLKGNITADEWLRLVYNYPEYSDYVTVGRVEKYTENSTYHLYTDYKEEYPIETAYNDSLDIALKSNKLQYTLKKEGNTTYAYPKYYVPLSQMYKSYSKISSAYVSPDINPESLLIYCYFALILAMAVFSFRVTSGRSWLIALVAVGIAGIITGIFAAVSAGVEFFLIEWVIIIAGLLIYFYNTSYKALSKGNSGIQLNVLLWLFTWLIPAIYSILYSIYQSIYYKENHYINNSFENEFFNWLRANTTLMMYVNLLLVIVYMYFFTQTIRKWKGKPEA